MIEFDRPTRQVLYNTLQGFPFCDFRWGNGGRGEGANLAIRLVVVVGGGGTPPPPGKTLPSDVCFLVVCLLVERDAVFYLIDPSVLFDLRVRVSDRVGKSNQFCK